MSFPSGCVDVDLDVVVAVHLVLDVSVYLRCNHGLRVYLGVECLGSPDSAEVVLSQVLQGLLA